MIRQIAQDTRKKLEDTIGEHTTKLTNAATKISDELYKAREDNDYFETDLERWMKKLDGLQNDLNQPPSINIDNDNAMSLIIKTLLNNHIV
jgi:ABC-type xylose transport system substrate-binding protein